MEGVYVHPGTFSWGRGGSMLYAACSPPLFLLLIAQSEVLVGPSSDVSRIEGVDAQQPHLSWEIVQLGIGSASTGWQMQYGSRKVSENASREHIYQGDWMRHCQDKVVSAMHTALISYKHQNYCGNPSS